MSFYTYAKSYGNQILYRGINANGDRIYRRIKTYKPVIYYPYNESSEFKDIYGNPLCAVVCDGIKDAKSKLEEYKDVAGMMAHGTGNFAYAFLSDLYEEEEVPWDMKQIRYFFADIEAECENGFPDPNVADQPINVVTIYDSQTKTFYTFCEDKVTPERGFGDDVIVRTFPTEDSLLAAVVDFWSTNYPDLISGWNSELFDIPYLVNRLIRVLGEDVAKLLSPFHTIQQRTVDLKWGKSTVYTIYGVEHVDYLELYKKIERSPRDNYKLDTIGKIEVEEEKVKHPSGVPGHLLYREHFDDFVDYNIQDVRILVKIDEKKNLIQTVFGLAYVSGVNYGDVMFNMRVIDNLIYKELKKQKKFIPINPPRNAEPYEGAYVRPTIPGAYRWVVSFDVVSEYPSIIRACNISPETKVKEHRFECNVNTILDKNVDRQPILDNDLTFSANGVTYTRKFQGVLPEICSNLFKTRQHYKDLAKQTDDPDKEELYTFLQKSVYKILLNSIYGVLGTEYFRLYDIDLAEGITLTGQALTRWVANDLNEFLQKFMGDTKDRAVAGDTDSVYFDVGDVVKHVADGRKLDEEEAYQIVKKIADTHMQKKINESLNEFASYLNAFEPEALAMEREAIANSAIFRTKKNYVMSLVDKEGKRVDNEMKITGLEAIRSATPALYRDKMKEVYEVLLHGTEDEFRDFMRTFRKEAQELPLNDAVFNRGLHDLTKWYKAKGFHPSTPIHARAAIVFNRELDKHELRSIYQPIRDGDKIKYTFLKLPNPTGQNVIGWLEELPPEFGLHDYIDFDKQFEKAFENPVGTLMTLKGWKLYEQPTLDSLLLGE